MCGNAKNEICFPGIGIIDRSIYAIYSAANNITLFDKITCLNINGIRSSAISAMEVIIIAVSIDRCLAVFKPVKYAKNDSKLFVYCAAACSIIFSAVLSVFDRLNVDTVPINVCSAGVAYNSTYATLN